MEYGAIVVGLVLLNIMIALWGIRVLGVAVETGMSQLDGMIAGAIQKLVEGDLMGSIEPPNPIQAAIAQMLTNRMQDATTINPIEIARDPAGKFSGEKIS